MKIKATLIGIGAVLALTVGFAGLSGTAAADPAKPAATPAPVPAEERPTPAPVPAEEQPAEKATAGPKEPVVVRPAYTG
ncbi:hypothetical protein ACWDR1_20430 [Streptosporangium sandarakinum]